MAYKTFVNGYPLNASELNEYLMNQSIAVFVDSTARSAAISTPVEGQFTYLTGTDVLQKWTGSAWETVGGVPSLTASRAVATDGSGALTASSVTATELGYLSGVTSAVQTQLDSNAYKLISAQSFTTSSSVNVNSVFTSTYENYQVFVRWNGSAAQQVYLRWRVSGADDSNTKYNLGAWGGNNSFAINEDMVAQHTIGWYDSGWPGSHSRIEVFSPQLTTPTKITMQHSGGRSGSWVTAGFVGQGGHVNSTSFDGFTIYPSTGTISGVVRIYGLKN